MSLAQRPKDFFVYIGTAVALYASAGALISILFAIIDASIADPLTMFTYSGGARFGMATLIIAFPIYVALSYFIRKDIVESPEKSEFAIRKWFIYLTLFLAGALVAGDLVALVYRFLDGELTARFACKVIAILAVAALIFGYYWYDLKRIKRGSTDVRLSLAVGAAVLVVAVLVWAFMVLGTPGEQRNARLDQERIWHLQSIQSEVTTYWQNKRVLPRELSELELSTGYFTVPTDPETGEAYAYTVTGPLSFELCATFATVVESDRSESIAKPYYGDPYGMEPVQWQHGAGEHCFDRTIDPAFYPLPR